MFLIDEISYNAYSLFLALYLSLVVQFSKTVSVSLACPFEVPFAVTASILYHIRFDLSRGFSNFFKFFSLSLSRSAPSLGQLEYYITYDSFCQEVFQTFFMFSLFLRLLVPCLFDSLPILSHLLSFVNPLFHLFLLFFKISPFSFKKRAQFHCLPILKSKHV